MRALVYPFQFVYVLSMFVIGNVKTIELILDM